MHFRLEAAQFAEISRRLEQEHAAVPVVIAAVEVGLRRVRVGFFNECLDRDRSTVVGRGPDVAITGFRRRGHDAERDELTGIGRALPARDRRPECIHISNNMVRRHDQQQRIRIVRRRFERSQGNGRRRVAPLGLENNRRAHFDAIELLGHRKTVILVADDQAAITRVLEAAHAQRGRLQHGLLAGQRQQLLRVHRPRRRPQARAGAAGQDNWKNIRHYLTDLIVQWGQLLFRERRVYFRRSTFSPRDSLLSLGKQ